MPSDEHKAYAASKLLVVSDANIHEFLSILRQFAKSAAKSLRKACRIKKNFILVNLHWRTRL